MFLHQDTLLRRREFIDYIYGLIRHEIHKGDDNPHRLEVLNAMYRDLTRLEDLSDSKGWYKKTKDKDELQIALDNIVEIRKRKQEAEERLNKLLNSISEHMTKKSILDLLNKAKKEFGEPS